MTLLSTCSEDLVSSDSTSHDKAAALLFVDVFGASFLFDNFGGGRSSGPGRRVLGLGL